MRQPEIYLVGLNGEPTLAERSEMGHYEVFGSDECFFVGWGPGQLEIVAGPLTVIDILRAMLPDRYAK